MRVRDIRDVAASQLCCGCGACAYISPEQIEMVDALDYGRRPVFRDAGAPSDRSRLALDVCPGIGLAHTYDPATPGLIREIEPGWGPVLELWEGYAADPEIRFAGSSGGAASALAIYCIEKERMHGALHTAAREDVPYLNRTLLSRSREEILERTGSRYAPASPCDGLQMVETAPRPCVFIGKPCDVAALRMACGLRPALEEKLGLAIAFFCAGTPSARATLEMIRRMGIDNPASVTSVRYRGRGWPGRAAVRFVNAAGQEEERSLSYEESWGGILQVRRQWRCYICADHSGEFADVSVGDPWYREIQPDDPGRSLIVVRTDRGRRIVRAALDAGYLEAEPASPERLRASQVHFEAARGNVWGRLLALRLAGAAAPRYRRMPLFRFWWRDLSWMDKLRSLAGTVRRVLRKGLRRRVAIEPYRPPSRGRSETAGKQQAPEDCAVPCPEAKS
ncbi:MAG: Coenzyme F420 hydrogenase/dehydrogenase, beta subunit C-terminal domain [Planctomycetes bacterium]|nr:Coenzyme F420 hydrogenase/dehydrogenase, beta subunit C-terminal domain [Planctomycetota bacterium]